MFFHRDLFQLYLNMSIIVTLKNILRKFQVAIFSTHYQNFVLPFTILVPITPIFYQGWQKSVYVKNKEVILRFPFIITKVQATPFKFLQLTHTNIFI